MPDTAAVQEALERILRSAGFVNSPRMSRFLRFVVEETAAGRAGELKEYVVGVRVFDKAESYDPAVDPTVRVEAAKLRAKLGRYYEGEGRGELILIEIPKGGYSAQFSTRANPGSGQPPGGETAPSLQTVSAGDASTRTAGRLVARSRHDLAAWSPAHGASRVGRRTVWLGATAAAVALTLLSIFLSRQASPSRLQASDHRLLSDLPAAPAAPAFPPTAK